MIGVGRHGNAGEDAHHHHHDHQLDQGEARLLAHLHNLL
jgi:hypothetical protein